MSDRAVQITVATQGDYDCSCKASKLVLLMLRTSEKKMMNHTMSHEIIFYLYFYECRLLCHRNVLQNTMSRVPLHASACFSSEVYLLEATIGLENTDKCKLEMGKDLTANSFFAE